MEEANELSTPCANCGSLQPPEVAYCGRCGQRTYQGPPTMGQLFAEFFDAVFSLDNRLFRTLGALVVPGRLTNNFLSGKQKPYFHPLRLFFVSGVLAVAAYSVVVTEAIGDSLDASVEQKRGLAYRSRYGKELNAGVDSIRASFPQPATSAALDSLVELLNFRVDDNSFFSYLEYQGGLNFKQSEAHFTHEDYMIMTPNEIVEKYEVKGLFNQYQVKQIIRLNRLGVRGVNNMMGQLIWGLLILVPLAAALLKLLYIRGKRKYSEHFVFTLNVHSFLFVTQFLGAVELYLNGTAYLVALSGLATVVYFLMSLKRVYRQGWIKTTVKAAILGFGYFNLLTVAISVAAVIALLIF